VGKKKTVKRLARGERHERGYAKKLRPGKKRTQRTHQVKKRGKEVLEGGARGRLRRGESLNPMSLASSKRKRGP